MGWDRFDEMWEGELHMVPPPSEWHQRVSSRLLLVLIQAADACGLVATHETGHFEPGRDDNYRQPDIVVSREEDRSARGVEGAAVLVVEIRSPNDETDAKIGFYAAMGVAWMLIVEPVERTVELLHLVDGALIAAAADPDGWMVIPPLDVAVRTAEGPLLELRGHDGVISRI